MAGKGRIAVGAAVIVALSAACVGSDASSAAPTPSKRPTAQTTAPRTQATDPEPTSSPTEARPSEVSAEAEARDIRAIRGVYKRHRRGVLARNGTEAAATVSRATLQYYEHLRREALTAGPGDLAGLNIADQVSVGLIRAIIPPQDLAGMDGELLFSIVVDIRLFDQGGTINHKLDTIKLTGDVATARTTYRGERSYTLYDFRREDGVWKFEPISTLATTNLYITRDREDSGMTEEEYVLDVVNGRTGEKHGRELFRAPNINVDVEADA